MFRYIYWKTTKKYCLKGYSTFFWEIGSFFHSPRLKQLGFTVFECIQTIYLIFIEYQ